MKVCYYALKNVRVEGEVRSAGQLLPEATTWRSFTLGALINANKIAPVLVATLPKSAQEELERWERDHNAENVVKIDHEATGEQPDEQPEDEPEEEQPAEEPTGQAQHPSTGGKKKKARKHG